MKSHGLVRGGDAETGGRALATTPSSMPILPRTRTRWLLATLASAALFACAPGDPESSSLGDGRGDARPAVAGGAAGKTADDVGAVAIRRLNAVEYDNTVMDLLGDSSHPASAFPPDDGAYGFTNIGQALTISPLLFEQYELSASRLAEKAITNPDIMICEPAADASDDCAARILAPFLKRAWRRRVAPSEVKALTAVVAKAIAEGVPFADAVQVAIEAALLSPNFLFHVETDPDPTQTAPHPLDDYELASRLSYFLWNTMPDDALFAFADVGKLSEPRVLERQVRRMLADSRASALIDNFASQWLLHGLDDSTPDPASFPTFDEDLRSSMAGETKAFVGSFLLGDQALPDMLDAGFTFLNARLAAHYGIGGVSGSEVVRVPLDAASHRGGLLTQASILTMTSVATRTSVVRRGEWVLSELLCSPPPAPPPNVPALPVAVSVGTMRQRLDEHRKDPACQSCHTQMDPIGFALEHYDALGRWRDTDQGSPIDATGKMASGRAFDGADELAKVVKSDPRFIDCVTRKLFTYALGRVPGSYDERRLKGLVAAFAKQGYRTKELVVNIIGSDAFRMRRGGN